MNKCQIENHFFRTPPITSPMSLSRTDPASLDFVKNEIAGYRTTQALDTLKTMLMDDSPRERKIHVLVNQALLKLSLELVKSAITDCKQAIALDQSFSLAFFVEGLAYLWSGHEETAVEAWENGVSHGGPVYQFALMKRLTVDHNLRAHVYRLRFDIVAVLDLLADNESCKKVFTECDTQQAFTELTSSQTTASIAHFNLILAADPENYKAYKGRGCAECLVGQWKNAIDDLTKAINGNVDVAECSRFRAIAYAALGHYSAAVADFSVAIAISPMDFESVVERAKIQMIRKFYMSALSDFQKIMETKYDEATSVAIAECHYALGDLEFAKKELEKYDGPPDQKKLYCYYLTLRELGMFEEAKEKILKAVELLPTFFLLRTAGDFMFDLGKPAEAARYYVAALNQKPGDAETQRLYALVLFEIGEAIPACSILQHMSVAADEEESGIDLCQDVINDIALNGDLKNFNVSRYTRSILKEGAVDGRFMLHLMRGIAGPVTASVRELSAGATKIGKEELFDAFTLPAITPSTELIEDADRLGRKCLIRAREVVDNVRVIRALGLCVLMLAHKMKNQWLVTPSKDDWREAIELCRGILNLADLRTDVSWIVGKDGEVRSDVVPVYYLQRGERLSPRFYKETASIAMLRLRTGLTKSVDLSSRDLSTMTRLSSIYSLVQRDISISGTVQVDSEELPTPSVNVRHLGAYGWELFVKPPTSIDAIHRYHGIIANVWEKMMTSQTDDERLAMLPYLVDLIWLVHPLSAYSHELGHVVFHAFVLAVSNSEVPVLEGVSGEIFIRQMIAPKIRDMTETCKILYGKKVDSCVSESSLDFWNEMPSVAAIMRVLMVEHKIEPEPVAETEEKNE